MGAEIMRATEQVTDGICEYSAESLENDFPRLRELVPAMGVGSRNLGKAFLRYYVHLLSNGSHRKANDHKTKAQSAAIICLPCACVHKYRFVRKPLVVKSELFRALVKFCY